MISCHLPPPLCISIGTKLGGAGGASALLLFLPSPGIFALNQYVYIFVVKSPKIPVLHQHYLPHFGAQACALGNKSTWDGSPYWCAIISKYLRSKVSSIINVKILILSYKISIFAFRKTLLEQRYLEMIAPLEVCYYQEKFNFFRNKM